MATYTKSFFSLENLFEKIQTQEHLEAFHHEINNDFIMYLPDSDNLTRRFVITEEIKEELHGYIYFTIEANITVVKVVIDYVYVVPRKRGKGLGYELTNAMCQKIKEHIDEQTKNIEISCSPSTPGGALLLDHVISKLSSLNYNLTFS